MFYFIKSKTEVEQSNKCCINSQFHRVPTDLGKLRKGMEVDNAFYQGLKSFGKGSFFKYGNVLDIYLGKF